MISENKNSFYYLTRGLEILFGDFVGMDEDHPEKAYQDTSKLFSDLEAKMNTRFDPSSRDGLTLEAGRIAFDYLLKDSGTEIGIQGTAYRMLPTRSRLEKGFQMLSSWINSRWSGQCSIEATEKQWCWKIHTPPGELKTACHDTYTLFMTGLIQGFMSWASGGKYYPVKMVLEKDVCNCLISKTPLD